MNTTAPAASPGIALMNAGYSVDGRVILSELSTTLVEQRIGILGRNGSGKTSLLRLIAGLIAPTTGAVTVDGLRPEKDRREMLSALGILFQNPDHQIIFPTVEEELAFGLRQQGRTPAEAQAAALAALARHGRSHWAKAPVATLSQGQRHFLCLLSILVMEPRTILLDEPFTALDLPTQIRLTRQLAALPQRLITITHDPALLAGYDRVIWLENGRILRDGPAKPVIAEYKSDMTRLGASDADADLPR
ncbi:energy-coupling factor ABC transporter ATP-binding protein [Cereibacter changlensis]|uniref:energy-coupling factor ABC transporter ATP-binding protein n=1 Tax=Cereibacter changlensis TaxID=402884 RepID=UPI0040348E56